MASLRLPISDRDPVFDVCVGSCLRGASRGRSLRKALAALFAMSSPHPHPVGKPSEASASVHPLGLAAAPGTTGGLLASRARATVLLFLLGVPVFALPPLLASTSPCFTTTRTRVNGCDEVHASFHYKDRTPLRSPGVTSK